MSTTALTKFSQTLIFGFESLNQKTTLGLQTVKDLSAYFLSLSQLEAGHAKSLQALAKTIPGSGFFSGQPAITKENATLKKALTGSLEKQTILADKYLEFSKLIETDICKVLDAWVKTKEADRKKIVEKGQKIIQSLKEFRANVGKAKETYEKTMQATAQAFEQFKKAEKDEAAKPDDKRLKENTKKLQGNHVALKEKAVASDKAYQEAIKKANEEIESYKSEKMPAVLEELQKWEEERWTLLVTAVKTLEKHELSVIPTGAQNYTKEITDLLKTVNMDQDLKEFVESAKFESELGQSFEYTASKAKIDDDAAATEKKPETAAPVSENKPLDKDKKDFTTMTAEEKEEHEKKQKEEEATKTKADPLGAAPDNKEKTESVKNALFGGSENEFK